ncbi:MAG: 2-oxoacid:ferredoxin oxidoreductase subunit beta [Xanthomonadales bacterium]|nr:2-oxoacid:ferredoxin oxidoreductase subunit beta [Gammaproteobacteria bacterium]MBT8052966.1 2-oxoacid:ferredoxin oxidoreductase subunit beta [Gammaproteobacteria bacterium]NND57858.1 2-oxoacid:ferredoxin oxidoreductase subunit beta [Xanthomonadales bacterium]NNK50738.1 2-oxoacid:ferredoxin oxidoreductase subunit beta [Xanthomonadales bacterium]
MTYIAKPKIDLPGQKRNELGLTERDYEGAMSTLCAGCGHDSITAALIQALWEMSVAPHQLVKMSGIGCSSKTPAYFVHGAHGFNSVHGRMPSVATGAMAANRDLICVGISGDGDSLSIGFGQFGHVIRRNLNMLYMIENNGVYGLTKGQFSASADPGSTAKKGEANEMQNINTVATAISMGATFVARSFSGDREQLIPLIKAAIAHPGCAILDVFSPCVTFNDHVGSTKSYAYVREHLHRANGADLIMPAEEISVEYREGETLPVEMHDGSMILLKKVDAEYDPTSRPAALGYLEKQRLAGYVVTGLLFVDDSLPEMHAISKTAHAPLKDLAFEDLSPGGEALVELQKGLK